MDELSHDSMSACMPVEADVVIAGAGLSGLYAAYLCRQQGLSIAVLEARDLIGGRIFTQVHHGVPLDLGAMDRASADSNGSALQIVGDSDLRHLR